MEKKSSSSASGSSKGTSTSATNATTSHSTTPTTSTTTITTTTSNKKRLFSKDLRPMLYGFGDVSNPRQDTTEIVEDCLLEYLEQVLHQASLLSHKRGKLKTEDILMVLKRDPKKYGRMEELLFMNEELKRVRKAFDTEE